MASNVTPSTPGAPSLLGQPTGFAQRLQLADMHVQSPKPPGRFSLRLAVYPPPQFLQTDGRLCHLAPASPLGRRKHRQRGPFARRTLLRVIATTDPSVALSSSADFPV